MAFSTLIIRALWINVHFYDMLILTRIVMQYYNFSFRNGTIFLNLWNLQQFEWFLPVV